MSNINFTAGYPFNRGQWVGHTESPFSLKSPLNTTPSVAAEAHDSVCFSSAASAQLSSTANTVTVQPDDTLSQLLLDRGYSLKEMLEKDEQGKTMLDRVAADNKLRNADLIHPGQQLTLPSKDRQDGSPLGQEQFCPCESDFEYESDNDYNHEIDYDYDYDYNHGPIDYNNDDDYNADCGCDDSFIGSEAFGDDWESDYESPSTIFSNYDGVLV